jgi:hypothetical protein
VAPRRSEDLFAKLEDSKQTRTMWGLPFIHTIVSPSSLLLKLPCLIVYSDSEKCVNPKLKVQLFKR